MFHAKGHTKKRDRGGYGGTHKKGPPPRLFFLVYEHRANGCGGDPYAFKQFEFGDPDVTYFEGVTSTHC